MKATNWLIIALAGTIIIFIGTFFIANYPDRSIFIGDCPCTCSGYYCYDYHLYYKCGIVIFVIGLAVFVPSIIKAFISPKFKPLIEKWLTKKGIGLSKSYSRTKELVEFLKKRKSCIF